MNYETAPKTRDPHRRARRLVGSCYCTLRGIEVEAVIDEPLAVITTE
jgi:hypothetical protein